MASATLFRAAPARSAATASATNRLEWVDYAKGIGIILVVFGHVWRGLKAADLAFPAGLYSRVDHWVYSFHMPLFFVLAGLFAARAAEKPAGAYLVDKLRTIAFPYFLWSLIQGGMNLVLSRHTNSPLTPSELAEEILLRPYGQFWFLYALMIQFVVFLPLRKMGLSPLALLAVGVVGPFLLSRTGLPLTPIVWVALEWFGYFALGNLIQRWLAGPHRRVSPVALLAVAVVAAGVLAAGADRQVLERPEFRIAAAMVGISGVLAASFGLQRLGAAHYLVAIGKASLPIYVAHILATAACRMVLIGVFHTRHLPTHLFLGTAAGVAFPFLLDHLARRYRIKYLFSLKG